MAVFEASSSWREAALGPALGFPICGAGCVMEEAHEGLRIPECGLASKLAAMAASVAGGPSSSPIFAARFFSDDNLSKVTAERSRLL
ncbi:hypothetical protein RIF29_29100 [Crotalaria pallida]|uniref:Uncharacterized protein n=1 Tax=Crotalaria pallida TaxID=3830 RepID=A0AAN9HTK7_CROPI